MKRDVRVELTNLTSTEAEVVAALLPAAMRLYYELVELFDEAAFEAFENPYFESVGYIAYQDRLKRVLRWADEDVALRELYTFCHRARQNGRESSEEYINRILKSVRDAEGGGRKVAGTAPEPCEGDCRSEAEPGAARPESAEGAEGHAQITIKINP